MPCSGAAGLHGWQVLYDCLEDSKDDFEEYSPVEQNITSV